MSSLNVRISRESHQLLRQLSEQQGLPMQNILDRAIEEYRRNVFLKEANERYATLRCDPMALQEEQEERGLWEGTLADNQEEA